MCFNISRIHTFMSSTKTTTNKRGICGMSVNLTRKDLQNKEIKGKKKRNSHLAYGQNTFQMHGTLYYT